MSADAIFTALEPMLARWTMGGMAIGQAPPAWAQVLGDGTPNETELGLLALSSHFLNILVGPTPPREARILPDVPSMTMPILPDLSRPLVRRCLKSLTEPGQHRDLIHLVARRGYALHPADWMPSRHEEGLPDIYAGWLDWADISAGDRHDPARPVGDLTEESWSDVLPAARCVALTRLRRSDPARALALLAAKAATEGAEVRQQLIACLAIGLSSADIPYLQTLSADRAPKVRALGEALLARLGAGPAHDEEAAELAAYFELRTKGLLSRTRVLSVLPLKTPAQGKRRQDLFGQVDFASFARAFSLDTEALATLWPLGADALADAALLAMAGTSADDKSIEVLCTALEASTAIDLQSIAILQSRLDPGQRGRLSRHVLRAEGGSFRAALKISGAAIDIDGVLASAAGTALFAALSTETDVTIELTSLGLLASQPEALAALDRLADLGLTIFDPRLDMLRLNAALGHSGAHG